MEEYIKKKAKEDKLNNEKLSFSQYVSETLSYESLRECFYNYIIARHGELPRSDEECRDEIESGIAKFFKDENEKMGPTKIELNPKDFSFSMKAENGQMVDFSIKIEHRLMAESELPKEHKIEGIGIGR